MKPYLTALIIGLAGLLFQGCSPGKAEYERGKKYEKKGDNLEMVKWCQMAANKGYAPAQYEVGCWFNQGFWMEKSEVEAIRFWRMAAEQGHGESQGMLSNVYYYGWGVQKDLAEAHKWSVLARENGWPHGSNGVTPEQQIEGKRRAREFKPSR